MRGEENCTSPSDERISLVDKRKLTILYALTYIVIVLVRRLALRVSWVNALVGRFSLMYLSLAATSLILYPAPDGDLRLQSAFLGKAGLAEPVAGVGLELQP
jgi:hypothetical protein